MPVFIGEPSTPEEMELTVGAADWLVRELTAAERLSAEAAGEDPDRFVVVSALALTTEAGRDEHGVCVAAKARLNVPLVPHAMLHGVVVGAIVPRAAVQGVDTHRRPVRGWTVRWPAGTSAITDVNRVLELIDLTDNGVGVRGELRVFTHGEAAMIAMKIRHAGVTGVTVTPIY